MKLIRLLFLCGLLVSVTSLVSAGESDSKTDDGSEKAIELYNSGVKHLDKAKDILMVGDSAFAYNYRATSDAKAKKEYEHAVKDFKDAIQMKPDMKEAYNNLGFCYRKLDKLEESLKAYKNALKLDPDFAQALEYMGETYLALDQLEKATEHLKKLSELKSAYADTLSNSIEIYKLNQINKTLQSDKK